MTDVFYLLRRDESGLDDVVTVSRDELEQTFPEDDRNRLSRGLPVERDGLWFIDMRQTASEMLTHYQETP